MRVLTVRGMAGSPKPLKTGVVVRELLHELHEGVLQFGRLGRSVFFGLPEAP
jgi:hypothetical protein